MAAILLDSSVIFDHLNGRSARTAYLDPLLDQSRSLGCCPVILTEAYARWQPREELRTKAFLDDPAMALEYRLPLLTDNRKHFPMPEIQLYPLP